MQDIQFSAAGVVVNTALTLLGTIVLNAKAADVEVELDNLGAGTLNDFRVTRQLNAAGSYTDYLAGTDFGTAGGRLRATSRSDVSPTTGSPVLNTLNTLAASQTGWAAFDPGGAVAIQIWASVASGTAAVNLYLGARTKR